MYTNEPVDTSRRRLPGVGSLPGAGFFNDRLNDAVMLLGALPEIVVALRSIQEHIIHLDGEVVLMRTGVDSLEQEVRDMRGELGVLADGMHEVSAAVARLEPHIADISRLTRPLKRRRSRLSEHDAGGAVVTPLVPRSIDPASAIGDTAG
ncbi:hypothetical protein [Conexibacter sp. DBS9H8]|uniref:hypothetical protein n=1 Tax=Conexibacter sp. DBS9H8 TaxID=2937801 RepID=UPI0020103702|nr:hypothetical protein [Conexibacter sp. DBS9H8]